MNSNGGDVSPCIDTRVGKLPNQQADAGGGYVIQLGVHGRRLPCAYPIDMRDATRTAAPSETNRQGSGIGNENGPAPTLTGMFTPATCVCGGGEMDAEEGASPTIGANMSALDPSVALRSVVRRLTPLECERLTGLPDFHTLVPTKKWRGAYDGEKEYVVSHIPEYEQYFIKVNGQVRTCLPPDGPRYKACGNGWAGNSARVVVKRIHDRELAKTARDLV